MADKLDIKCPFCEETGFDSIIELKRHIFEWCEGLPKDIGVQANRCRSCGKLRQQTGYGMLPTVTGDWCCCNEI